MSASLQNEFISDTYTSLLHLSGGGLYANPPRRDVYDGSGNITGFTLSGTKVIANNVAFPEQHVDHKVNADGDPQVTNLIDMFFPVGSIQMTIGNDNPEDRLPGTQWSPVAAGRFVVGVGSGNFGSGDPVAGGVEQWPVNPSNDYANYEPGNNIGGMGPAHEGLLSEVSLSTDQLPRHTHIPAQQEGFGNIVTWSSAPLPGETEGFIGAIDDGRVPNPDGVGTGDPIYAFPATQPVAQTLDFVGKNQAFSISPVSYGAYIWKRTQ